MSERKKKENFTVYVRIKLDTSFNVKATSIEEALSIAREDWNLHDCVEIKTDHNDSEYEVYGAIK